MKGFTLVELLIVIVIIAVLAVIMFPSNNHARFNARLTRCGAQLNQLIKACYNYSVTKMTVEGFFHDHNEGGAWLLWLKTPGYEVSDDKVFNCPLAAFVPGGTNYRGYKNNGNSAGTINQCPNDTPVIADRDENHGQDTDALMNYAIKSGSCHRCNRNSPKWTGYGATDVAGNVVP